MHSSKSSLRSYSSSCGETSSSQSSRRQRMGGAVHEPSLPPAKMEAFERLQLVRNAVCRLQYVCERELHMARLDQAGGDHTEEFFERLRQAVPGMLHDPQASHSTVSVPAKKQSPKQLQRMLKTVQSLQSDAEKVLQDTSKDTGRALAVYDGLKLHHLQEAMGELTELNELLSHPTGSFPSRVNTELLSDMVAFHVDEFDSFADERLGAFITEMKHEGSFFSGLVGEGKEAEPYGLVSPVLLDVSIGVRPGRSARMVLEHAATHLTKLQKRLKMAEDVLHASTPATPSMETNYEVQKREFHLMKDRLQSCLSQVERLKADWETAEKETFDKAKTTTFSLEDLIRSKQLRESQIIAEVQTAHDRAVHACLPFSTPQYDRRYCETYSQPCHIRLGFHFIAHRGGQDLRRDACNSLLVNHTMPDFFTLMRQHQVPVLDYERMSYLVPSSAQIWVSWSEFPEMVRGSRCSLRGVHTRMDHFRGLEEQKEVGGYFIMNGHERILRALMMQRCNVAINIERDKFQTQGPHFSSKAVVIRCKRPSGITVQNYFYYTTIGDIIFSFARKVVWHIPMPLLLFATSTHSASSMELVKLLSVSMPNGSNHLARVEALLQHHQKKPYSHLTSFLDYLSIIGRMYCDYHRSSSAFHFLPQFSQTTRCQHDAWYGLFMLRRHLLSHLNAEVPTPDLSPNATPDEVLAWLPQELLDELQRKFVALIAIARQLYLFIDGKAEHAGNDVPAYQELFTVSQVLMGGFEVCLRRFLRPLTYNLARHCTGSLFQSVLQLPTAALNDADESLRQLREALAYVNRGAASTNFLAPLWQLINIGNLKLDREEDFYCPQTSGWQVMAEHLNFYRFFEQLRCIHRGKTIADMRSSEVRRYPSEAYGFICMVHSPDGSDCGVLNHLSVSTILSSPLSIAERSSMKSELMAAITKVAQLRRTKDGASVLDQLAETVPIWLEGELVGYTSPAEAEAAADALRSMKLLRSAKLVERSGIVRRRNVTPINTVEVIYVAPNNKDPKGLYVFYDSGRLMRPVQKIESVTPASTTDLPFPLSFIGTWEQSWLDIACVPSDLLDAAEQLNCKFDYMEQNGSNIISLTSTTIPFFEYNCSPRNLFQCGLSKQSAGTQMQALGWRKEAKLFRMYSPQRYISRTLPMDYYHLDDVNLGVNAVVAILAYTGYDLDDAVVLNSTASQRGMLTAGITVAKIITASGRSPSTDSTFVFHNIESSGQRYSEELEANGLPRKRANPNLDGFNFDTDHKYPALQDQNDVYCCAQRREIIDPITNARKFVYEQHHTTKWRHFDKGEKAWVHQVVPLVYDGPDPTSVLVVFRIPRPPTVGDKFASRHGQKGTLPLQVRSHDLPFSSRSGIAPDVIINPHAFPSRMTVGMVLEIMTAKIGALEGRFMDNSAWSTVDEEPRLAEMLGDALCRNGYNRYGRETLIDGISGEEMEAEVFMGISGYQRVRHMVSDKWQARARTDNHTHRAVTATGQPVKGRKRHGGVRVGEMERDGLLSHGMSEVVLDRLLHVSDKTKAYLCPECGSLLSIFERHASSNATWKACSFCHAGAKELTDSIVMVDIPQVLRLWATELTSVGVRVVLKTSETSSR